MKRKNIIPCVIILMLIIVSLNILININIVSGGRWVFKETVQDVYNITSSSDDAIAVIDNYFASHLPSITLKSYTYDLIIGLRFTGVSLPLNSTHSYSIFSSFLSVYSELYPYSEESGRVTIYADSSEDAKTFSNYTDLVTRSTSFIYKGWDLDDVHGSRTIGEWCDSTNINYVVDASLDYDNDTVSLILLSSYGDGFRNFLSYDDEGSNFAPRLYINYDLYEWQESPPSGYEDSDYVETYRGYDIFITGYVEGLDYDLDLTQGFSNAGYSEQDEFNKMTIVNNTHYNVDNLDGMSNTEYYNENYDNYMSAIVLIHLNITDIDDGGAGTWNYPYSVVGFGTNRGSQWQPNRIHLVVGHHYDNDKRFKFWLHQGGGEYSDFIDGSDSGWFYAPYEVWILFMWDGLTDKAGYILYDSKYFDNAIVTKTGYSIDDQGEPFDTVTFWNTADSGLGLGHVWGDIYMYGNSSGYVVANTDGSLLVFLPIDIYEDIEDVRAWIDNYLSASSEYDKTPWMGDFTLLLVGIVGIAFIPLGFLIFVSSVREGDIIGGLQTLVLMFFIGIGCIITWLWA